MFKKFISTTKKLNEFISMSGRFAINCIVYNTDISLLLLTTRGGTIYQYF